LSDRLYQLPLAEFTAARNALAKEAGADKAAILALEKPSVPAWAVNQLYWRERRVYDRLVKASERVRAGHAQALKGKRVDLAALELEHDAAVKRAADRVRGILAKAGDPATPATMKAVIDTLRALPGGEPGRLTKALAPMGFGALGAILKRGVAPKTLAEIVTFARPAPKPTPDEAAETARREREAARHRVKELDLEVRRLEKAIRAARAALDRVQRLRTRLQGQLENAAAEADRRRAQAAGLERDLRAATEERERLARLR
jgi:hypothetical protein